MVGQEECGRARTIEVGPGLGVEFGIEAVGTGLIAGTATDLEFGRGLEIVLDVAAAVVVRSWIRVFETHLAAVLQIAVAVVVGKKHCLEPGNHLEAADETTPEAEPGHKIENGSQVYVEEQYYSVLVLAEEVARRRSWHVQLAGHTDSS